MANDDKKAVKAQKQKNKAIKLPNAWKTARHSEATAAAKADRQSIFSTIGVIAGILLFLFVILGGVSMTGALNFVLEWSHNIGTSISNWIGGGSLYTNEDGIYYDPSGQQNGGSTGEKVEVPKHEV